MIKIKTRMNCFRVLFDILYSIFVIFLLIHLQHFIATAGRGEASFKYFIRLGTLM